MRVSLTTLALERYWGLNIVFVCVCVCVCVCSHSTSTYYTVILPCLAGSTILFHIISYTARFSANK
jgi:hypothetical protein